MKFAISSCWNSHRHDDGYALMKELAELGFSYVELSHGTRVSLVPGILRAVEEGVAKVASVHNFCPLPVGIMGAAPNLYEPSAVSRRERILWLHNTLKTIDFAHRIGCDRVVLHSGQIRFLWGDPGPAFETAFENNSESLEQVRKKGLKRLHRKKHNFMKRLKESYSLVAERGKERGVRFGVENREAFTELPLDEDMASFQEALKAHEVFGYWHDSGHAQLKERMGLLDHRAFLEKLRPHLIGFHLHDVSEENRDHQVPGSGVIDWSILADAVQPGDVVVMEMSPRLRSEDIRQGREFLLRTIPALRDA
ncbi:MAG TPA: TIM barrel protein [Oceanipulchritudo sp.]|nr:TIM barrel protein [Oceanipulchritudo sp.]